MSTGRSVYEVIIKGNAQGGVAALKSLVGMANTAGNAVGNLGSKLRSLSSAKSIKASIPQAPQFDPGDGSKTGVAKGVLASIQQLDAKTTAVAAKIRTALPQALSQASVAMLATARKQAAEELRIAIENAEKKKQAMLKAKEALEKAETKLSTATAKDSSSADYKKSTDAAQKAFDKREAAYSKAFTAYVQAENKAQAAAQRAIKKTADVWTKYTKQHERDAKRIKQETDRLKRSFEGLFSSIKKGWNETMNATSRVVSGFRQAAQGLQELFLVGSLLLAGPLLLLLRGMFKESVDFEQQMAKVKKAVEFSDGEKGFAKLEQRIRNLAKITPTAAEQIALFAEQAGQLGIEDEGVYRFVNLINKVAIGTDVAADSVAEDMGRIAAAFGMDLNTETGMRQMEKLASVMDFVAKKTSTDMEGIITAMKDAAVVGPQLRIHAKDVAVMVGMMINSGVDPSAAGTNLSRFFVQLLKNADKFAEGMRGYVREIYDANGDLVESFEPYKDVEEVISRINVEPVMVLRDALSALYNVEDEDRAASLRNFYESIGLVGGRVGAMAANQKQLGEMLDAVNDEWETAITLQADYAAMLMTTDSQLKIAKNNLSELGYTIGAVVMPAVNELLSYAIPIIQDLTKAFAGLDGNTKLLVIGIPLIAAALIPVLLTLSTLGHALTLVGSGAVSAAWGFGTFVANLGGALAKATGWFGLLRKSQAAASVTGKGLKGVLGGLTANVFGLAKALNPIALLSGLATIGLKALSMMGLNVSRYFLSLADKAEAWGLRLMQTYSSGLVAGAARFIGRAISFAANMIARFFESHSPPLEGPLSDIDQWGSSLMNTFMQGFMLADFSILSEVTGRIRRAFDILKEFEKLELGAIPELVWAAKEGIAQLIAAFNETGEIAESVLEGIGSNLGSLGGDIQQMIRLFLEYNKIQKRIAELEKAKKDTLKTYDAEIAKISKMNITAEEKAELMRQAMATRDDELRLIEEEKIAQEEAAEAKKEELDWQREYIDAQLEMFDLLKDKQSGGGSQDELFPVDFTGMKDAFSGLADPVQDLGEEWNVVSENIEKARAVLEQLKNGWLGKGFLEGMTPEEQAQFKLEDPEGFARAEQLYSFGVKARDVWDDVSGKVQSVGSWFSKIQGSVGGLRAKFDEIANSPFIAFLQKAWDATTANIDILGPLEDALTEVDRVLSSMGAGKIDWSVVLEGIVTFVAGAIAVLMLFVSQVINIGATIIEYVLKIGAGLIEGISTMLQGAWDMISGVWDIIRGLMEGNWGRVLAGLTKFIGGFLTMMQGWGQILVATVGRIFEMLAVIFLRSLRDLVTFVVTMFAGPEAGDAVRNWFNKAIDAVQRAVDRMLEQIRTWKNKIRSLIDEALSFLGNLNLNVGFNGGLPDFNNDGDPGFAKGAIVTKPTRAWVGEGGEAEAIMPLSKLPGLLNQMYGGQMAAAGAGGGDLIVQVYNPVIREKQDIRKLADEIKRTISKDAKNKMRMGNS